MAKADLHFRGMLLVAGSLLFMLLTIILGLLSNFSAFSDNAPGDGTLLGAIDHELLTLAVIGVVAGLFLIHKAKRGRWPIPIWVALLLCMLGLSLVLTLERALIYGFLLLLLIRRFAPAQPKQGPGRTEDS